MERNILTNILIISGFILSFASGYSTYRGLIQYIPNIFSLLITVGIQGLLYASSWNIGHGIIKTKDKNFFIVCIIWFIALISSASFSYLAFFAINYKQKDQLEKNIELAVTEAKKIISIIDKVDDNFFQSNSDLYTYSKWKNKIINFNQVHKENLISNKFNFAITELLKLNPVAIIMALIAISIDFLILFCNLFAAKPKSFLEMEKYNKLVNMQEYLLEITLGSDLNIDDADSNILKRMKNILNESSFCFDNAKKGCSAILSKEKIDKLGLQKELGAFLSMDLVKPLENDSIGIRTKFILWMCDQISKNNASIKSLQKPELLNPHKSKLLKGILQKKTKNKLRAFLCYSKVDKNAVRQFYSILVDKLDEVWFDEENLLPGHDWKIEVLKAVKNSDIVIVCLSNNSLNKIGYVNKEIKYAIDIAEEQPQQNIFIIPVKLEDCKIPDALNKWHYVNLYEENGIERLFSTLKYCSEIK